MPCPEMETPSAVRILQLFLLASFQTSAGRQVTALPKVNLSQEAENIHLNISNVVSEAEKNLEDWLNDLLLDWGLPGWAKFWVKAGLLILFIIFVVSIAFCCIKCMGCKMIHKLIPNITAPHVINQVTMPANREDEEEPEEFVLVEVDEDETLPPERYRPLPFPMEEWSTDQEWDAVSYSETEKHSC